MKLWGYTALSALLAGLCTWRASANTSNAAQALAYLMASKASVLVHPTRICQHVNPHPAFLPIRRY
jgi:hypothetical protein